MSQLLWKAFWFCPFGVILLHLLKHYIGIAHVFFKLPCASNCKLKGLGTSATFGDVCYTKIENDMSLRRHPIKSRMICVPESHYIQLPNCDLPCTYSSVDKKGRCFIFRPTYFSSKSYSLLEMSLPLNVMCLVCLFVVFVTVGLHVLSHS